VALDTLCKVQRADEDFFLNRLPFLVTSLNQKVQDETESFLRQGTPKTCPEVAETLRKEIAAPGTIVGFQRAFEESLPGDAPTTSPKELKAGARKSRMACSDVSGPLSKLSMEGVLRRARCASDSGQYLLSLRAAEFASKREPDNVEVLYWRAEATRKLAQASFEKAVQLDPDSWQGNILVGDIYRQRGKYALAIQHYEAAAKTNPAVPASYLGLATSYWQTGKFDEAVAAAQKVLQLDPHNTQAKFEIGDIHVRRHEFNEAVPYLQAVIAAKPENLIAHGDLGKAWAGLGKVDEAIRELTIAMPTDEQGDLHYQLFLLYKKQGKKDLAQQALATSKQLRERSAQLRATRLARAFKAAHAEPQDEKQETPAH